MDSTKQETNKKKHYQFEIDEMEQQTFVGLLSLTVLIGYLFIRNFESVSIFCVCGIVLGLIILEYFIVKVIFQEEQENVKVCETEEDLNKEIQEKTKYMYEVFLLHKPCLILIPLLVIMTTLLLDGTYESEVALEPEIIMIECVFMYIYYRFLLSLSRW